MAGECGKNNSNNNPCEHICLDSHDGTYECSCFYGFTLAVDGYSCAPLPAPSSTTAARNDKISGANNSALDDKRKLADDQGEFAGGELGRALSRGIRLLEHSRRSSLNKDETSQSIQAKLRDGMADNNGPEPGRVGSLVADGVNIAQQPIRGSATSSGHANAKGKPTTTSFFSLSAPLCK